METIIIIFTVLGGLLGLLTYYKKFVEEPNELKKHFVQTIETSKKVNNEFLIELTEYVDKNNVSNEHFMQGFSFSESIKMLETYRDQVFSTEHMKAIKNVNGNSIALEEAANKAAEHIALITQCKTYFRKNILKKDWEFK